MQHKFKVGDSVKITVTDHQDKAIGKIVNTYHENSIPVYVVWIENQLFDGKPMNGSIAFINEQYLEVSSI